TLLLLRELNESEGQTLVVVSHDPAVASTAGRVVFLRDGRLAGEVEGGSTDRVVTALAELDAPIT
ncbi:MAG: ABC transporter ATP-binding protein, partial [Nocardioidaceae bacterium]